SCLNGLIDQNKSYYLHKILRETFATLRLCEKSNPMHHATEIDRPKQKLLFAQNSSPDLCDFAALREIKSHAPCS
ncbi:MAG: hypothetical protein EA362_01115, partial [Saprospirales bacterium]